MGNSKSSSYGHATVPDSNGLANSNAESALLPYLSLLHYVPLLPYLPLLHYIPLLSYLTLLPYLPLLHYVPLLPCPSVTSIEGTLFLGPKTSWV